MSDCYFLSYARIDVDEDPRDCIRRFYNDLDQEVRRQVGLKGGQRAGFFDSQSTQLGERWPEAIGNALRTCCALISLYSSGYFNSEYCGKECTVFLSRVQSFEASRKKPPVLFFPILFDHPLKLPRRPPALTKIQYVQDDYPKDYRENGLRHIMVRDSLKETYQSFLDVLVSQLLQAIEWKLPELTELPDLTAVASAFNAMPPQPGSTNANAQLTEGSGPNYVDFVYVAARRSEVQPIKTRIEAYGEDSGMHWKPYWPELSDEIVLLAQKVATKESFFLHQSFAVASDLPMRISEAQSKRRIVVLIVDIWTLRLPPYREIMRKYDDLDFWNSCVMIAWNQKDEDTAVHSDALRDAVRIAFVNKSRSRDKRRFVDSIDSPKSLRKCLGVALKKLKLEIIEISEDLRRIETDEVFPKPEIPVPV